MANEIIVALIAAGAAGMGAFVQWRIMLRSQRADRERLRDQLLVEFRQVQFSKWQERFQNLIAELLSITDPDVASRFDQAKIVPLIHRIQLMLNLQLRTHQRVNGAVNNLGHTTRTWRESDDLVVLFRLHSELMEAARDTLHLPGSGHGPA